MTQNHQKSLLGGSLLADRNPHRSRRVSELKTTRVVLGASLLIASLTACVQAESPDGSSGSVTTVATDSSIEVMTTSDLERAVTAARKPLLEASGYEAIQTNYIGDYLASALWIDSRGDEDYVVVQRADVDVLESGWWLTGDAPQATGAHVETTVFAHVGGTTYVGEAEGDWTTTRSPVLAPTLLLGTAMNLEEVTADAEVTIRDLPGGMSEWIAKQPYESRELVMTWTIGQDGVLQSYSGEVGGGSLPDPFDLGSPIDSTKIELSVSGSSGPIVSPTPGEAVTTDAFDIPETLPLG